MNYIKKIRKEKNITQEQLANILGLKRSVISKYENGMIDPSVSQAQKIADILGVSLFELLNGKTFDKEEHKENSAAPEEDPSETAARAERLYRALVDAGWIPEGGDLTDEQLIMLKAAILILQDAFPESN